MVCIRLRFELISRGDGVTTDAGMKPQKNVPQAEHMPHVMPRARSSKSSGRVRQIKQRSAEQTGCGDGCWCSGGAVWVDGCVDFGAFLAVGTCEFNACGEAWMLPLRDGAPYDACGVPTAANITELHLCVYARAQCEGPLAKVDVGGPIQK